MPATWVGAFPSSLSDHDIGCLKVEIPFTAALTHLQN